MIKTIYVGMTTRQERIAILDVDGTIVKDSMGVKLAEILSNNKTDPLWDDFWAKQGLFNQKGVTYDQAIEALSEAFAKGVKGNRIQKLNKLESNLRGRSN